MVHHSQICTSVLLDHKLFRPALCPTQSLSLLTVSHTHHNSLFCWKLSHIECLIPLTYSCGCAGYQARFSGSQPSMKFIMDTSKFWFRPHISRAEGENLKQWPIHIEDRIDLLTSEVTSSNGILLLFCFFLMGCRILLEQKYSNTHLQLSLSIFCDV